MDGAAFARYCARLAAQVGAREFAPDTIHVVADTHVKRFAGDGVACGRLEGYYVCVSAKLPTRFAAALGP